MLVNLTPHVLNIQDANGSWIELPHSGKVARVAVTRRRSVNVYHDTAVTVYESDFGAVEGLPEDVGHDHYVVSRMVIDALRKEGRSTYALLAPGELIRDEKGQPIGCLGLSY